MNFRFICFVSYLLYLVHLVSSSDDATLACQREANSAIVSSPKDHLANPDDCHKFFQCFRVNETHMIGIEKSCPPGQFWRDKIMQCGPEGAVPCQDLCLNEAYAYHGCYADSESCSSYFVCSNSISYKSCCPKGTRFNEESCICEDDNACLDECNLPKPPAPQPTQPPESNSTHCKDSFGNVLALSSKGDNFFTIFDPYDSRSYDQSCALGALFDLNSCRCDIWTEIVNDNPKPYKQCRIYLPFEDTLYDQSVSKYPTQPHGDIEVDPHNFARGRGSLFIDDGYLEIPALKTVDFGNQASWCFFFKCHDSTDRLNPSKCSGYSGLLSNNHVSGNQDFSLSILSTPAGLMATLKYQNMPWMDTSLYGITPESSDEFSFNQVCLVYTGKEVKFYINKDMVSEMPHYMENLDVRLGHWPYIIGLDPNYGKFKGFVDEVLICDYALSAAEVEAHYQGQAAMFALGMVPNPPPRKAAIGPDDVEQVWEDYKLEYGIKFKTEEEEKFAFEIFKQRYSVITNHNELFAKGEVLWEMKTYRGMHIQWKSLASGKLGFAIGAAGRSLRTPLATSNTEEIPLEYDSRPYCANPIKDQGFCGACFAFSSCAAIEGAYCRKHNYQRLDALSPRVPLGCTRAYGNEGCDGGLMEYVFQYFQSNPSSITYMKDSPYSQYETNCPLPIPGRTPVPVQIVSIVFVAPNEDALKEAIYKSGNVACAVHATSVFLGYKGGIFSDTTCSNIPNHAINFVGYGCEYCFKTMNFCVGPCYFIMQNSYGQTWGENGFMKFLRGGSKNCGIFEICSYVTVN